MLARQRPNTGGHNVFDTNLVIVGNVLTAPEWRRIANTGALVTNFRVASTARRYDRENGRWVDGNNLRIRVVAWRRLAEGVASSVTVGDPVVVFGRLYTRDWQDDGGNPRISYEMEAFSVGHDLARGKGRFYRTRATPESGALEDAESESVLGGEPSLPVEPEQVPVGYGEGLPPGFADEEEPTFAEPVTAVTDELTLEVEQLVAEQPGAARRSRRAKREPVAA
jgi:single-strand DNA-binding protein